MRFDPEINCSFPLPEGFASSELSTRIDHAEPKVIISSNCGVEPNKVIPYLDILHEVSACDIFSIFSNLHI